MLREGKPSGAINGVECTESKLFACTESNAPSKKGGALMVND